MSVVKPVKKIKLGWEVDGERATCPDSFVKGLGLA